MRLFFGIMLALSILLFVAIQWGSLLTGAGKGSQANGDMNPEKIILLDVPQTGKPASAMATSPAPVAVPASAPVAVHSAVSAVPVTHAVPNTAPQGIHETQKIVPKESAAVQVKPKLKPQETPAKPAAVVCMEWGEFSGTDLERAEKFLGAMKLEDRLSRHTVEYDKGYWVYLSPLKNKAELNKEIAQLKKKGVADYFVLRESGKLHNAISFGIFKSAESAKLLQADLRKKGIHNAKVGERKSRLKYIVFEIKRLNEEEAGTLTKQQKEFPNSELKKVACH